MFQVCKTSYNLRHFQKIANSKKNSVKIGLEAIYYPVPQLWNLVSTETKDVPSLSIFKGKIDSWYCDNFHVGYAKDTSFNIHTSLRF